MTKRPRGRPPIGAQAMTNGQRQQRYRQRVAQEAISLLKQISVSNEKMQEPQPASWQAAIDEILRLTGRDEMGGPKPSESDNYKTLH